MTLDERWNRRIARWTAAIRGTEPAPPAPSAPAPEPSANTRAVPNRELLEGMARAAKTTIPEGLTDAQALVFVHDEVCLALSKSAVGEGAGLAGSAVKTTLAELDAHRTLAADTRLAIHALLLSIGVPLRRRDGTKALPSLSPDINAWSVLIERVCRPILDGNGLPLTHPAHVYSAWQTIYYELAPARHDFPIEKQIGLDIKDRP